MSNKDTGTLKKYTDTGVFVADITGGLLLAGGAGLALGRRWKKPALRAA